MFSQCPECTAVLVVDAPTLAQAHGFVACGQCGASFDAMATLCDALPEEPFETLPVNDPAAAPPLLLETVDHARPPQKGLFDTVPAARAASQPDVDDSTFSGFTATKRRTAPGTRRLLLACGALALVLLAQLGWAERAALVRNPTTAAWMRSTCATLGCTLPMARDLAQLELTSRDVRRHPSVQGALLISATVHNRASFTQPWPVIEIELSDLNDQRMALRRFRPAEYLPDPALRRAGLAPGASAALVFEVVDPGNNAVAFEFSFL